MMVRQFRLPDLGSGLQEATVIRWHAATGEALVIDGILCEVETEKAVIEIPVPYEGTLLRQCAAEGDALAVGAVLALIEGAGDGNVDHYADAPNPLVPPDPIPAPIATAAPTGGSPLARPRAMPAIRRLARERGVDLAAVRGSGPMGRITRADVEDASIHPVSVAGREMSGLRQRIAEHMVRSWQEIPHCFARLEIDAGRLLEARRTLAERLVVRVPVEALLIKAVIPVLRECPQFNATLKAGRLIEHDRCDIGVAVDTPDGLIVPVAHGADRLSLRELCERLNDLLARTVLRRASPGELTGATFTVNNIGALGRAMGTSIIPWGTTAILSAGRAELRAVVRDGQLAVAPVMELALSFDHRVVDGGTVQRFIAAVGRNLEEPDRCLS